MEMKKITVTRETEVSNFFPALEANLHEIKELKRTNELIEQQQKALSDYNLELIAQYCKNLFEPIFALSSDEFNMLFKLNSYYHGHSNPNLNCSYSITMRKQHDGFGYKFHIHFSVANIEYLTILVSEKEALITEKGDTIHKCQTFFKGWEDFKKILNYIIEDRSASIIKHEKSQEKYGTEMLNILNEFTI